LALLMTCLDGRFWSFFALNDVQRQQIHKIVSAQCCYDRDENMNRDELVMA
jgi:hypothetical protein